MESLLGSIGVNIGSFTVQPGGVVAINSPSTTLPPATTKRVRQPTGQPANPFTDQGRIDAPDRFFDREEVLDSIFEMLAAGCNISLVGEAQVGKSSVLMQVKCQGPTRLQRPAADFVYLDMQLISSDEDFFKAFSEELGLRPMQGVKLKRALDRRRIILCLDEFEKMKYKGFTSEVRSQLRGLSDGNNLPLKLLLASRTPLFILFPDDPTETSPLANICRPLTLGNFPPDKAREFLSKRLKPTGLQFTPDDEAVLLAESAGHPGKLQELAYDLFQRYIASLR
jgi:hypothetical protein